MATTLPQITTARANGGWLNTCSCGWEAWHLMRPAADRAAHDHRPTHAPKTGIR